MHKRKPDWLKIKLPQGKEFQNTSQIINKNHLNTICSSGKCPNIAECWAAGTATFMILGDICTRSCKFCNTKTGRPLALDPHEPLKVAESIKQMKLKHAVITSVDRDDLEDLGIYHWLKTINAIKELNPNTTLETLIPDFQGREDLLMQFIPNSPEIISHNMETVERLTKHVRSASKYKTSLKVIKFLSSNGIKTKSGLMLGLGEKEDEVITTMDDLLSVGCKILTLGQYLQPSRKHLEVQEYIPLEQFKKYKLIAKEKGFAIVESGPLVRSSYHAEKHI